MKNNNLNKIEDIQRLKQEKCSLLLQTAECFDIKEMIEQLKFNKNKNNINTNTKLISSKSKYIYQLNTIGKYYKPNWKPLLLTSPLIQSPKTYTNNNKNILFGDELSKKHYLQLQQQQYKKVFINGNATINNSQFKYSKSVIDSDEKDDDIDDEIDDSNNNTTTTNNNNNNNNGSSIDNNSDDYFDELKIIPISKPSKLNNNNNIINHLSIDDNNDYSNRNRHSCFFNRKKKSNKKLNDDDININDTLSIKKVSPTDRYCLLDNNEFNDKRPFYQLVPPNSPFLIKSDNINNNNNINNDDYVNINNNSNNYNDNNDNNKFFKQQKRIIHKREKLNANLLLSRKKFNESDKHSKLSQDLFKIISVRNRQKSTNNNNVIDNDNSNTTNNHLNDSITTNNSNDINNNHHNDKHKTYLNIYIPSIL
jgi:hypothetical protein